MKTKHASEISTIQHKQSTTITSLPTPPSDNGGDFPPFLNADDLPVGNSVDMRIIGNVRPSTSKFGDGIFLDVTLEEERFTFDVKFKSKNYAKLFDRFGSDTTKWRGSAKAERGEYLGKQFVKII